MMVSPLAHHVRHSFPHCHPERSGAEAPRSRRTSHLLLLLILFLTLAATAQQHAPSPDRNAFTFTKYSLTISIGDPAVLTDNHGAYVTESSLLTARGTVTLRNDSPNPQSLAAMQISSQLKWASIKIAGNPVPFDITKLDSDIDHTGSVIEATFTLPQPLAPKATIDIEVGYSGNITQDATRLTRIGAPEAQAKASDWDRIAPEFTALRGVGHVVWYPVEIEPALLGRGNKLFVELGEFRARHAESSMKLDMGRASPDSKYQIVSNGQSVSADMGGVHKNLVEFSRLGLDGPLLVSGIFATVSTPQARIYSRPQMFSPESTVYAPSTASVGTIIYAGAVKKVAPEITSWLRAPQQPITVIQIPDPNAAPFESGPLLLTPFLNDDKAIQLQLAHTLAHAAVPSSRAWISEGLAHYAQLREREVQSGRSAAFQFQLDRVQALTLDEPEHAKCASDSAARSLINTGDEVLYRTKAMYVWWMLHDMLGDDPILKALRNYREADDKEPLYMERLIEAQAHRNLDWFFADWVYRDRGLPDFRVAQVYPRETINPNGDKGYLVTVTIENSGDAGAEVPVRVTTKDGDTLIRLEVMGNSKASARVNVASLPLQVVVNDGGVPESDLTNNIWKAEEKK
jgi:hypothetical protein